MARIAGETEVCFGAPTASTIGAQPTTAPPGVPAATTAALAAKLTTLVAAPFDRPIVDQQRIGDRAEPRQRVVVEVGDGLVAEVARGHHQRPAELPQQEHMQRRVGQHHADGREAGRHGRRQRRGR